MVLMAESSEVLQEMLDVLSEFMDERRLRVSTGPDQLKSAIMITRVKGDDSPVVQQGFSDLQFLLAGEPIPLVRHYRYLGVMLQDNGRWDRQYSQLRSSLGMRIADMVRAGMHPDGFDPQHGRMLIKAEIIPVVEYACGVWLLSAGQSKKLQSLWNACVRAAFGVPAHTSMPSLLGDLQLIECELQSRWDRCIIADLRHVSELPMDSVVRRCVALWNVQHMRDWNWLCRARSTLFKYFQDFPRGGPWFPTAACFDGWVPRKEWKQTLYVTLFRYKRAEWRKRIQETPHLSEYAVLAEKELLAFERNPREPVRFPPYLKDKNRRRRQFVTVLRAGSLPLQTSHKGKSNFEYWRCGSSEGSELCFMCESAQPETFLHFAFECDGYADLRRNANFDWQFCQRDFDAMLRNTQLYSSCSALWFEQWRRRMATWRRNHPEDGVRFLGGHYRSVD
jgi:hypothetical protein